MEGHYFTLIHILGDGFFLFSSRSFQECAFWGVVGNTSESISWDDFCVISAKVIITHGLSQWSLFLFLHLGSQLEHRRISITCAEFLRSLHILCLSKYWTHFQKLHFAEAFQIKLFLPFSAHWALSEFTLCSFIVFLL